MAKDFDLDGIVPWGRTLREYCAYFDLDPNALAESGPVLDVGGGPSSFTAEARALGIHATAVDPVYRFEGEQIRAQFEKVSPAMLDGLTRAIHRFTWGYYKTPGNLMSIRREALAGFLSDYDGGREDGRYVAGALPRLPFRDGRFRLALCSHLLFLYSDELDRAFHIAALTELLRVAREVRVFPLFDLDGIYSGHVAPAIDALTGAGFNCELADVPFEFQKGCRRMLRAWKAA